MQTFALTANTSYLDMPTPKFGALIKALRESRGLTQTELAEKTGISQQSIAKWENGTPPRPGNIALLAEALGVDRAQLIEAKEGSPSALERLNEARNNIVHARFQEVRDDTVERVDKALEVVSRLNQRLTPSEAAKEQQNRLESIWRHIVDSGLNAKLDHVERSGPVTHRVDIVLPHVFAEVMFAKSYLLGLSASLAQRAWRLAVLRTCRPHNFDPITYLVVVITSDEIEEPRYSRTQAVLQRYKFEAAMLGVEVVEAKSEKHAAEIIIQREKFGPEAHPDEDDLL